MFVLLLVLAVGAVSATTPGKPPPVPATSKSCPDPNAIRNKCASAETCRPTCEVPNAKVCPRICVIDGCECKPGYILSARGGKCVQIEECPQTNATCNGDPNAVIKANPFPCPSTCASPNALPVCTKLGPTVGCECKPGYIKSDDSGKCILPTECPVDSTLGTSLKVGPEVGDLWDVRKVAVGVVACVKLSVWSNITLAEWPMKQFR
ncbi:hypothetical protein MSG28_007985 [Choristoneura fumiferana]|uniref:Uncharacterized protein n=1 Tax=Choristoneura fumiferana TaxID=7141 RepID=A0ACC0J9G2_CHOFU|nr:hypothetical protein MSG28_007985 [Choristoneura fumiferana]